MLQFFLKNEHLKKSIRFKKLEIPILLIKKFGNARLVVVKRSLARALEGPKGPEVRVQLKI